MYNFVREIIVVFICVCDVGLLVVSGRYIEWRWMVFGLYLLDGVGLWDLLWLELVFGVNL